MRSTDFCYFIISCKKNIQVLQLLISSIRRNSIGKRDIYISLDEKVDFQHDESVFCVPGKEEDSFGQRVCSATTQIPYEHMIVMCDDFIVEQSINESELQQIAEEMFKDGKISSVALTDVSGFLQQGQYLVPGIFGEKYALRSKYSKYNASFQCSMWQKNAFAYLVKETKTPWEFELFANQRTFISCNKFYSMIKGKEMPIKYNRGAFVIRGKIVRPEKERLEKLFGEKIDIAGYAYTDSYAQIDPGVFFKIKRRIRLTIGELKYRLMSTIYSIDLNTIDK